MRTFAHKPEAGKETKPAKSAKPSLTLSEQRNEMHPILQQQRAVGTQAAQRLLQADAEDRHVNSNSTSSIRFEHDFSQIPLHTKEPTKDFHQLARYGTAGNAGSLPYLEQIQQSFGAKHDLRRVRAHVGSQATEATRRMGAEAYATDEQVAFGFVPDLRTAAHEAAHVVQQRGGVQLKDGVGEAGDPYEQHAEAVADTVVRGSSAEPLLDRIPASSGHARRPPVQRREDMDLAAQQMMSDVERLAEEMVKQYRNAPAGLAYRLISDLSTVTSTLDDWERSQVAYRVLEKFSDQAGLAEAIAKQLPNDRVRKLATLPRNGGLPALALTVQRGGKGAEAERIMGIVVSPAHGHLFGETASESTAVKDALKTHGSQLQSITGGGAGMVFDEYWIIMDTMPPNLTAEAYLTEMSQDINAAVKSEAFDDINEFQRTEQDRRRGAPAVGDVYDIDIKGPDNGSVMLVERTPKNFIFQTVATTQTGAHPEFGSREFGFEILEKGAVRWYTRGASRPGSDAAAIIGAPIQKLGWTAMLTGIGNTLQSRGGRLRPGSFGNWIRRM